MTARARTDWTVCRLAPDVAGSVEYLMDIRLSDARWLSSPLVSADRADAWTGHRQGADLVADLLNLHGGGSDDRGAWTALPVVIHAPSPYQPQEKGGEELRRGASAKDVVAIRACLSRNVSVEAARATQRQAIAELVVEARAHLTPGSKAE